MERSILIQYWRHPWRTPLFLCLIWILIPCLLLFGSYLSSIKFGYPFQLKLVAAIVIAAVFILALCYFLYSVSRSLKKITFIGEQILFTRNIGRAIAVYSSEMEIRKDVLRIGRHTSFRLDGMVNKEQVKDLLEEHIRAHRT